VQSASVRYVVFHTWHDCDSRKHKPQQMHSPERPLFSQDILSSATTSGHEMLLLNCPF
jgi:hypothetical protein